MEIVGRTDSGRLVYKDALRELAEVLNARVADKKQNVVVCIGPTGSGKSMAALYTIKCMKPRWSVEKNLVYGADDLKRKLRDYRTSDPVTLFDEGSVVLNSYNHMKGDDIQITVMFDTMRSLGWTSFICVPSLPSLNKRIREFHIDYLIRCPSRSPVSGYDPRGFATIYRFESRDWGQPWFRPMATTLFDLPPDKTRAKYEKTKFDHQMQLIQGFVEA